ncbi:glycoside hydrolase family 127 protein [Dactylosporangium vinaceum]|uniref:Glycoside hydrolase family 127 protein n=1 Tax=Dactylosporangium vinaceum TaxID=53362 RepID=A0ABV5MR43_9ACTN|nr:beta-L-arabinofuranosidase domain-containing protein [Dactylosporangium vinaceum]UAC00564.1 glycoside hydrolase family 127 protein [Dactylosporangium vinaceum]
MTAHPGPVAPARGALQPVGTHQVRFTGGFWGQRQAVNGTATIEHCKFWLDRLGWTGNFRDPDTSPRRRGREFSDSEVYKLAEAASWETGRPGGTDHRALLEELCALIAGAQAEDGYLHTAYGRPGQPERYSDLHFGHDLYCAGHFLQAAVAAHRTGAAPGLLPIARRVADHVCERFAEAGFDGHPEIETALVELYRVTGERRYLDMAATFVDRRGHRSLPEHEFGWRYFQDDTPVRSADVLGGHAVRALYLAAGAVDVAVETGDEQLLAAVVRQFDRTLARRTYITGGMGSRHLDEAFGDDFALPPDRAYSETCAAVATIMLAHRLLLATGESRYGDIVDRVLHNVIAAAVADDGRSFFYAHTLHQRTRSEPPSAEHEQLRFGGGQRAPWFEVSCCLTNVSRLTASLGTYYATATESGPGAGVQIHQYAPMSVEAAGLRLDVDTAYPEDGVVTVTVVEVGPQAAAEEREISLRIPGWAGGGRHTERRVFAPGEQIRLELPVRPRWTFPDPRVDAVRGCAAVEVGPVVMCAESIDQEDGVDLDELQVDTAVAPESGAVKGRAIRPVDTAWPYRDRTTTAERPEPIVVPLVPYHRWARRGPSTMRVWLPITPS